MPPSLSALSRRWAAESGALTLLWRAGPIVAVHLAMLVLLWRTEYHHFPHVAAAFLCWGLFNLAWIALLRRPGVSSLLSLAMIIALMSVSELKHNVMGQTVNFIDLLMVDTATIHYLLTIFPKLSGTLLLVAGVGVPTILLVWRLDPFRIRRRVALAGAFACALGLSTISLVYPFDPEFTWYYGNYVSNFSRSAFDALDEFVRHGVMESDAVVTDRLRTVPDTACRPSGKPPHIIMVHDESAFDLRNAPNMQVPPGYGQHFRSFDGKHRDFVVEAAGGPSWYTEYNVLAGLSSRSFGKFAYFVTKIAAGRVDRGLPKALRRCGYRTFSFYPAHGAFMGARNFQASTGVQNFFDMATMRSREVEPDHFYYDNTLRMIGRERAKDPMFVYIYLSANHFPWNYRWQPELTPGWKGFGNRPIVDEYLRRQILGMADYRSFLDGLRRDFPDETFLLVRYGDHQPDFAAGILEPSLRSEEIGQRLMNHDIRYYTTYYAIDAINYRPQNVTSTLDSVEAAYLPLIVLDSAGLPLDPSFAEQKKIFERCRGLFYRCNDGAEARRFNRLLIDAGLIKGL